MTPLLHQCTADEPGQKAESEQQKICLNRASSVAVLMRSRRSTSVAFDPPACGYGAAALLCTGICTLSCSTELTHPKVALNGQRGQHTMFWPFKFLNA